MTQPESSGRGIRTVKLWIKAFIPDNYEFRAVVPSGGEHTGKTMVTDLWLTNRCFLTDQRAFSEDIHAEARMHSEVEIDVAKGRETYQFHHCYDTVEVDCNSGAEKCREQGETDNMRFHDFEVSSDFKLYTMQVKAASKNPCIKIGTLQVAPNLDYSGTITIALMDEPSRALVTFRGSVELYPAFEMYVTVNDGAPKTVFQVDVAPSATTGDLPGGPGREVHGSAEVFA